MTPRETAKTQVMKRIVTIEDAKNDFRRWIDEGLALGGFGQNVLDYWEEVKEEINKL